MDVALSDTKRCKAKAKGSGERCKNRVSPGKEVCRIHGGKGSGRPIEHGRYSVTRRAELQEKIAKFYNDPATGDLRSELAVMRALLEQYLNRFDSHEPMTGVEIGNIFDMVDSIGRMVERIAKILATTALTQAELQLLQVTLIDALNEFVPNPDHRRAFISRVFGTLRGVSGPGTGSRAALTDIIGVVE